MPSPTTEAGRDFTVKLAVHGYRGDAPGRIAAIEAEAVAAERQAIIERVEACWTAHGAVSQAVVLAAIRGES